MSNKLDFLTSDLIEQAAKQIDTKSLAANWDYYVEIDGFHYPFKALVKKAAEMAGMDMDKFSFTSSVPRRKTFTEKTGFDCYKNNDSSINKEKNPTILELLGQYKEIISETRLKDEIYKWHLIKKYSGRPNTDSADFSNEMLSIDYKNLIYDNGKAVIKHLSEQVPDQYKVILKTLFDDNIDLQERINQFIDSVKDLYDTIKAEEKHSHFHDERTIASILAFYDGNKYPLYKNEFYKQYCQILGIPEAKTGQCYVHYIELLDDLIETYQDTDTVKEIIDLVDDIKTEDCFEDKNSYLLAQDFLFQMLDRKRGLNRKYWLVGTTDGSNQKSIWNEMLANNHISIGWNDLGSLSEQNNDLKNYIVNFFKEKGYYDNEKEGRATGKRKTKAGEIIRFYNDLKPNDVVIARDGTKVLGVGIIQDEYIFKPEFYFGHIKAVEWKVKTPPNMTIKNGPRNTVYPLTDFKTIQQINNLLNINNENEGNMKSSLNNEPLNQILFGPPGTGKTFHLLKEIVPIFKQNKPTKSKEVKESEIVSELPWWKVFALVLFNAGKQTVPQIKEHKYSKYKLAVSNTKSLNQTVWGQLSSHTVQDSITVDYASRQGSLIFDKSQEGSVWFIKKENDPVIDELKEILEEINTSKNDDIEKEENITFVTFHQSTSYENFIEGIHPVFDDNTENENKQLLYEVRRGKFYTACNEAAKLAGFLSLKDCIEQTKEKRIEAFETALPYAVLIDEINRGNVSAIFGELITLIEEDKRLTKNEIILDLPYSRDKFAIPPNLYIYGTMNTADRSVEALDTALRRRFSFKEMMPKYDLEELEYQYSGKSANEILKTINQRIELLLDRDHLIGHSYFIKSDGEDTEQKLINAFYNNIFPLLQEYFYGDYEKIGAVLGEGFVAKETSDEKPAFASGYAEIDFPEKEIFTIIDYRAIHSPLIKEGMNFETAISKLLK